MRRSALRYSWVLIVTAAITAVCNVYACSPRFYNNDPNSKTEGYKFFKSSKTGLVVSFEYPNDWKRMNIEQYGTFINVNFDFGNSVSVSSDEATLNKGGYPDAAAWVQDLLKIDSSNQDFQILSQGQILLDQINAEELTCTYRLQGTYAEPPGTTVNKMMIDRFITSDYKGRIYDIHLFVDADKYEAAKNGFEHLIDTFRFLN